MYDPKIGRWMTEDPIEFEAADPDLYRYVHNDSTNLTDPSGLYETYDAENAKTKDIKNCDEYLEKYVNAVIQKARAKYPKDKAAGLKYIFEELAQDQPGTGFTQDLGIAKISIGQISRIEAWLGQELPKLGKQTGNKFLYQFTYKETWYRNNKIGGDQTVPMFFNTGIANHAISPTIRVSGTLMGTDKWGHFFQQGYWYFENKLDKAEDREAFGKFLEGDDSFFMPPKNATAEEIKSGRAAADKRWTKIALGSSGVNRLTALIVKSYKGMHGAKVSGIISYADMNANEAGYKFYKALSENYDKYTFRLADFKTDLSKFKEYNEANPMKSRIDHIPGVDVDYTVEKKK
jgi:hypothetical protein